MKKLLFASLVAGMSLSLFSFRMPNNCNHNHAEGAARSSEAFRSCVQAAHDPNFEINYYVVSTDGAEGCTYSVMAIKTYRCTQEPCPKIAEQIVAVASVDVNYNVTSVTCNK